MKTFTLQEAKAKLNQLVDDALAGEDVVLMRGSKIVATIRPLTEADLDISPRLTNRQAERFWQQASESKKRGFRGPREAVTSLKRAR